MVGGSYKLWLKLQNSTPNEVIIVILIITNTSNYIYVQSEK